MQRTLCHNLDTCVQVSVLLILCYLCAGLENDSNQKTSRGSSPSDSKIALDRASSIQSSSSQQSSSTIRSQYSLMPLQPDITVGAHLADLTLSPNLPELADLPAMDQVDGTEIDGPTIELPGNCCSTCFQDQENDSDDENGEDRTNSISCDCGSCSNCEFKRVQQNMQDLSLNQYSQDDLSSNDLKDLESHQEYQFSEHDYSQYDESSDYRDPYYKERETDFGLDDQLVSEHQILSSIPNLSNMPHSDSILNSNSSLVHSIDTSNLAMDESASDIEEQHLDYSVESAQDILSNSYSRAIHNYDEYMSPSLGSECDSGRYSMLNPTAVTMATVKTSTQVAVASSKLGVEASGGDPLQTPTSNYDNGVPYVTFSEAQTVDSFEAPAKVITSRHKITVLKAHAQETYSPPTTFQAVPLTRGRGHTLPQVPQKPKSDGIQSLQRHNCPLPYARPFGCYPPCIPEGNIVSNTNIDNNVPIIRKNNYLDFRASTNLNKHKSRFHHRQPTNLNPRRLYLPHQKKDLQKSQQRDLLERQRMEKKLCSDTVYQADAYAQGVGVPLQPTPTIAGYATCPNNNPHHSSHVLHNQNLVHQYLPPYYQGSDTCESIGCPYVENCSKQPQESVHSSGCSCSDHSLSYSTLTHQHSLSSAYGSQVSLSQLEQYKAQLNSNVDFVVYPHKDPAISRQEYMDAKHSQLIANQIKTHAHHQGMLSPSYSQKPVPLYRSPKMSPLYRSTPNVGDGSVLSSYPSYHSLESQNSMHQPGSSSGYSSMARERYFSQQSLASSLSSTQSGYSASTHSLSGSYEQSYGSYGEPAVATTAPPSVMRVRSDESILSSAIEDSEIGSVASGPPHVRPPPPYRHKVTKYVREMRA